VSAEVVPFDFKGQQIRTVTDEQGDPWWVAADLAAVLDLGDGGQVTRLLDDDERGLHSVQTNAGLRHVAIVSLPGLFSLILRSRKPEAREFKRWVTHGVLPAIRVHGGYLTPAKVEEFLTDPDTLIRLAQELKAERAERQRAELQAAEAARQLETAEPKAKAWIAHGWVFRGPDSDLWPYADRVDCGHYDERTGEPFLPTPQRRVTARGLDLLAKRLASHLGVAA
jgi:anti-repressor protein